MYKFNLERKIDNMYDYEILFDGVHIGEININNDADSIFIRHIGIDVPFRRCGHAKKIIEEMSSTFQKKICFCIATNSESAVKFWNKILEEKKI